MPRVACPHCQQEVEVPEPSPGMPALCPLCAGFLEAADPDEGGDYSVANPTENPHRSEDVQQYVQALEKRARRKRREKPYRRRRFPVDLVAGVVLLLAGLLVLGTALFSDRGLMNIFVNSVLPSLILFMLSALCLIFWQKTRP